jgi:hypothetical protein
MAEKDPPTASMLLEHVEIGTKNEDKLIEVDVNKLVKKPTIKIKKKKKSRSRRRKIVTQEKVEEEIEPEFVEPDTSNFSVRRVETSMRRIRNTYSLFTPTF